MKHLIRHDYSSSKFPISKITDATNHFARKSVFCKLDCSQAYHSSAILGLQYVILCDASSHGIGFVLLVQDYLIDQKGKTEKTYAPVFFVSRLFTTTQLNFSGVSREFPSLYFAPDYFAEFICGATKSFPVFALKYVFA